MIGDDFGWGAKVGSTTSAEMSVRVVTKLMNWDAKVAGGRTWVMGPKELLAEYLPEYPVKNWGHLSVEHPTSPLPLSSEVANA
jgi:hypothetical protein